MKDNVFSSEITTNCVTDFSDYDYKGRLKISKYFELFEQARFQFAKSVQLFQLDDKDIFFPVTHIECNYIKPINIIDEFYIYTFIEVSRFNKIIFKHKVLSKHTGEIYAFATTIVSMVSKSKGMPYLLDKKFYDKIKCFNIKDVVV